MADTKTSQTTASDNGAQDGKEEAKSHFNAAIDEAKAGAAALGSEAKQRAQNYRDQAKSKGDDWAADVKEKATDIATEGKTKASEALSSLSRVVSENADTLDEKLGETYGNYARTASSSLQETAARLDEKTIDQILDEAREVVRNNPAAAVGIAAVAGFMLARTLRK